MKSLTFDQMKQAGRFAWRHDSRVLWTKADGLLHVYTNRDGDLDGESFGSLSNTWTGNEGYLADNWHHLPGCSCQFCAEAGDE